MQLLGDPARTPGIPDLGRGQNGSHNISAFPAPSPFPTPNTAPPEQRLEEIPTLENTEPRNSSFPPCPSVVPWALLAAVHEVFQEFSRSSARNSRGAEVLVSPTPSRRSAFRAHGSRLRLGSSSMSRGSPRDLTAQGINLTGNDQTRMRKRRIFRHNSRSLFPSGCEGFVFFFRGII